MNLLITGCCGHIGSYLVNNIYKINKIKKTYIIDNFYSTQINSLFNTKEKNFVHITKKFFPEKTLLSLDVLIFNIKNSE